MEPDSGTRPYDPELDRPPGRRTVRLEPYFEEYQRLVANPFLALAALLLWLEATRAAIRSKSLLLVLILFAVLLGIPCLLQFHCLDCGRTRMLFRWKRHACDRSIARQLARKPRRFRGPNPTIQMVIWGYALAALALLSMLLLRGPR